MAGDEYWEQFEAGYEAAGIIDKGPEEFRVGDDALSPTGWWETIWGIQTAGDILGYFLPHDNPVEEDEPVAILKNRINEWETVDSLPGVTTTLTSEFIDGATDKWLAGVKEYRAGNDKLPFEGDCLEEAKEECLDLYGYSVQALKEKRISETEHDMLNCFAFDAYKLIRRIQENAAVKQAPIVGAGPGATGEE